jgi:hypothetical protein
MYQQSSGEILGRKWVFSRRFFDLLATTVPLRPAGHRPKSGPEGQEVVQALALSLS